MAAAADAGWTPDRSAAGHRSPWLIVIVISLATFMEVLDTAIANVSLLHIAGSLSITADQATWVITSYLVANAIVVPISGWLADVIGRKRYYLLSVIVFTAASLACGLAPSIEWLIVARVIQGLGGGGLATSEQSILADTFPPSKRGQAFAAYGVVVVTAPILGPTVGGVITDSASWHWIFLINVPVGIVSFLLVKALMAEPPTIVRERVEKLRGGLKVDWIGFALVALGLGCLELTLDRGERADWFDSPSIVATAVVATLALTLLVWWELRHKDPIINLRLLKNRNFAVSTLVMMTIGVVLFGTTQLIPQFLQQVLGYSAADAGRALTVGGVISIVMMPLAGLATTRLPPRWVLFVAMAWQVGALWNLTHLNSGIAFSDASTARLLQAIGMPFLFITVTTIAYVGLKPTDTNQASALLNVMRNLGGTMGIAFAQTLLAHGQQRHQAELVAYANPLDPNYASYLDQVRQALAQAGSGADAALGIVYRELQTQALTLAFIDVFYALMIFIAVLTPLTLLAKPGRARGAGH